MVTPVEVFDLVLSLVIGVLYGAVAVVVSKRAVSAHARLANYSFAVWWWGLAALTFFGGVWTVTHWFIEPTLPRYMTWITFLLLVIMVALAGLLYYFLFLWSGRENLWIPIALFYLVLFIFYIFFINLQEPTGFDAEGELVYANDLSDTVLATAAGLMLLLPVIIGAGVYFALILRVREPILRFRIGVVASSILVWFLVSLTSSLSGANETEGWTYISRAISAAAAVFTLVAYQPPALVRHWFNLDDHADDPDDDGEAGGGGAHDGEDGPVEAPVAAFK